MNLNDFDPLASSENPSPGEEPHTSASAVDPKPDSEGALASVSATPPGEADSEARSLQVRGGALVKIQSSGIQPACEEGALEPHVTVINVKEIPDDSPPADPVPVPPYQIYGWNETGLKIWARSSGTEQLIELSITRSQFGPLRLHTDVGYWADRFPGKNGAIDVTSAIVAIMKEADAKGVFDPGALRGRGCYLDEGRVVFNRGDVLEVDGQITRFSSFETRYFYMKKSPLPIDLSVPELSDEEGQAMLDVVRAMGWEESEQPLYVVGFVVLSLVCGAIPFRPALQISSAFSTGKGDVNNHVIIPLQAGIGHALVNPTEAGVRQLLDNDSLPIWIDESENEDPRKRHQQLQFARYSYDGMGTCRGGTSGKAITYSLCSSVSISGINATIPNSADRSRIICIRRQIQPPEAWASIYERRKEVITHQTGERLLRRVLNHLPTLLANIKVFTAAIQATLPEGVAPRYSFTFGATLAGAHLMVSTQRLSEEEAGQWLDDQGWIYRPDPDAGEHPATQESSDCLEHLLSYSIGGQTVRTLVDRVKTSATPKEDTILNLGQMGLKVERADGLLVANRGKILDIFKRTRWALGSHRDRLKELPLAKSVGKTVRFKDGPPCRCVLVPWSAISLDSDPEDTGEE